MQFETVIGLEIHVQLLSTSKAFCKDANRYDATPNTNISMISLAHPGTLPKMNKVHMEKAILLGLAFDCHINRYNYFDRKNYFYPDLPKGYQITQDKAPYCKGGHITFITEGQTKTIRLHHIHLEEDAGKSIHDMHGELTMVDYNRAGVPLLEIVTEPDFRSGQEVSDFMAELQKTVKYLGISDGNMEEGSFRCDCNVSVRVAGTNLLGERCEIKNMNSRRFAKMAIEYEAQRQIDVINSGGSIQKSTMLYDPVTNTTRPMRKKESENDYRYFPEPDLPPVVLTDQYISEISKNLIALPINRYKSLTSTYNLSPADAEVLLEEVAWSEAFFALCKDTKDHKDMSELLIHKVIPYLKSQNKNIQSLGDINNLTSFVNLLESNKVAKSAAYQHIFPIWISDITQSPTKIATELHLIKSEDQSFLDDIIQNTMIAFPEKVNEYKKGKKGLIGFFMGQVMQKSGGKADPKVLQRKMEEALK